MKVLSLFDGMACGMLAMMAAKVNVERYVAFEIDKYAVQTASHNFPMIEQRGDVFTADFTEFCDFDYLVGGSPCTYWSIAQKNNRETEASGLGWELFCQYVRALNEARPRYFIYENNKSMSKAIRQSITETFGFEPICINSALVSAQNRQRLYWVGKRNLDGTYSSVHVEQPHDRGILLIDILDNAIPYSQTAEGKGYCQDANYWKTPGTPEVFLEKKHARANRTMVAEPVITVNGEGKSHALTATYANATPDNTLKRHNRPMIAEVVNATVDGKAQCLRATCYKDGIRHIVGNDVDRKTGVAEPVRVAIINNGGQGDREGKSCSVTAQGGGTGGSGGGLYAIPVEFEGDAPTMAQSPTDGKIYRVYSVMNGEISIKDKQYSIKLPDGYYIIRKLTVRECKRLQTVPEWYEFPVSDTQAYKMLGNGWTVLVICHLISATLMLTAESESEQADLPDALEGIKNAIIRNADQQDNVAQSKPTQKVKVRVRVIKKLKEKVT